MKKHSFRKVITDNWFLFRLCFKAAPVCAILLITEYIRNEVVIFLEFTFGLNYVLECAEFGRPFRDAAVFLLCLLSFVVLGLLFNAYLYQKVQMKSMPKMKQAMKEMMYQKAREIDLACYDDPQFYNDYVLSVSEAENQVDRMFGVLQGLFTGVTSILLSGAFFAGNDPVSFLFVAVSFVASLWAGKALNKLNFNIRNEKNPYERKLGYVNRVFYLNDYAKEVRLNTEVSDLLLQDFDATNDSTLEIDRKYAGKRFFRQFAKDYLCNDFLIDVVYMVYLVYSAAVLHRISYSNVAVMRGAANRMKNKMRQFSGVYPQMQEISLYVEKMQNFLNIKPEIISRKNRALPEKPAEIELKNVSFGYNEKDGYILKNISMKIEPYSKIAIVGYNGAGKTTLIKLIMRLYDPNEGEILLDGVNIKEYNVEEYRRKIGTVFQDFKIFAATVKENVLLDFAEKGSDEAVRTAIEKSGFTERLETLPGGLSTNLTTEFEDDGVNLSGGEGQKLAVARVFYKEANLIILDEPSSALDPIAEYHLNHSMLSAAEHKSVVFISHRLSTTRIADRIYMLENGSIIEEGSHDTLLENGGKYAKMWRVQAGQYL
ncbi:MAG: ABC transporter ATP-binding protein [Lachnospiraceae bacterium]|nr:ABC transporter ATP-binding protein [Lachnospiraceae bacterium]MBD5498694.1 ABC transporter ATP-binding protein [Lachnospiraceae bacterium]MBD5513035.1 ABC transporter ATP-binding protein [Lachnospiraceae bacterium]